MATSKWDELLPNSAAPNSSRADVVQQMLQITAAGASGPVSSIGAAGEVGIPGSTQDFTAQISSLATQITNLASVQQTQVSATQDNTQALTQNTSSKSSASSAGQTVGGAASTLLGSGSILSPLISGLLSAFGGSSSPAAAPTGFMLPGPVQYESGITETSQVSPVTFGQGGQPRVQATAATPQINIQVSAMDSQSFLDHSDDIATAVKTALLNSHSLSDVISGL